MTTIATLDGSLRTIELGTLEAIELCFRTVGNDPIVRNPHAYHTLRYAPDNAMVAYAESQSDDELAASNAREALEDLMRDTESAMYDLGYLAYWHEGWFYLETIDCDESDTE